MTKHRIPFDVTQRGYDDLVALQKLSGAASIGVAIRNAISLYRWYIEARRAGAELRAHYSDGKVETVALVASEGAKLDG